MACLPSEQLAFGDKHPKRYLIPPDRGGCNKGMETMPSTGTEQGQLSGNAPKITPAVIEEHIAYEHYFTARQGAAMAIREDNPTIVEADIDIRNLPASLGLMTFCVLTLRNGFTVVGKSAVASPSNFSQEIGQKVAREDAVRQIWPLLGYKLVDDLHRIREMGSDMEGLDEAMTRLLAHQLGNEFVLRSQDAEVILAKLEGK